MVNFRVLSENDFKYGKSDYAKSLRAIYGDDGYKRYAAKINSIMEEQNKSDGTNASNPLKKTNAARVSYLTQALQQAVADNNKARTELRRLSRHLSGMLNLSGNQQADLAQKQITYGKTDMNEDLLRSSLLEALHSQGMYYNA